jgi:hypothetical protein
VKHSEIRARLSDYIDRELVADERSRVDTHLGSCGDCRRELEELRATVTLLQRLPEPPLPPGIGDAVLARIARGEGRETRVHSLLRRTLEPRWIAPLAAGLAGLFFLVETRDFGVPAQLPASGPQTADTGSVRPTPYSLLLGGAAEPATRAAERGPAPRAGVLMGATPAGDYAENLRQVERSHSPSVRDDAEIALEHRATRRARVREMSRLLSGSGHPFSTSVASHFDPRSGVVLADWQPR